jgi:hypothetical protein
MQNLDLIANELFNKIRGRFPSVTIGDAEGNVTNEPKQARYFDFDFMNEGRPVGKISISLDDKNVAVVYGESLVSNETELTKNNWYDFLKELRMFARKRALTFDTRDITKSNLNSRDYKFLAKNRDGDGTMTESKMYGTSKISYQDFDGARLMIKHTEGIDQEAAGGRAKKVGSLYIESAEGERFKYPYKHITGARAMARHVAEGGNAYDDFGKHIVSMSEEMNKLRKFKSYMGRSAVMAESLAEYVDVVKERIVTVKKTLESLQRPAYYKETFEAFAPAVMEDVPTDVAENWIDQLTIRQFNEELSDVFPYIYKLVSEASKAEELTAEDLMAEVAGPDKCWPGHRKVGTQKGTGKNAGKRVNKCKKIESEEMEIESAFEEMMGQFAEQETNETQEGKVGTMALFVTDQDGGEHEVEVEVEIKNGKPEIVANTLPGPEDRLYWDDADIEQQAMDAMKNGDIEFDESFDPQSEPSERDLAVEDMMNAYEKGGEKALAAYMHISEEELDQDINEWCAEHGKHPDDDRDEAIEGVVEELADMTDFDEGNAYSGAVAKAKMNGKKKGDKVDGPDGDEITLEKDEKTPLGEFILSYYDKEAGEFPKGETAILTMVEKDYGNEFIEPAKQFITKVYQVTEEYREPETSPEFERMRELAGLR